MLRQLGREAQGYLEHGAAWEDLDSGLVLLVCLIVKLAGCTTRSESDLLDQEQIKMRDELREELAADGATGIYIVEGAQGDDRCGIGIHATDPAVFDKMGDWGRNQLGCVLDFNSLLRRYRELKVEE